MFMSEKTGKEKGTLGSNGHVIFLDTNGVVYPHNRLGGGGKNFAPFKGEKLTILRERAWDRGRSRFQKYVHPASWGYLPPKGPESKGGEYIAGQNGRKGSSRKVRVRHMSGSSYTEISTGERGLVGAPEEVPAGEKLANFT